MGQSIMSTPYGFGYMVSSAGQALGLNEAAVQNPGAKYVTSTNFNVTVTQAALAAVLPSTFTSDFSGVSLMNLAGASVYPVIVGNYIAIRASQALTGEKARSLYAHVWYFT